MFPATALFCTQLLRMYDVSVCFQQLHLHKGCFQVVCEQQSVSSRLSPPPPVSATGLVCKFFVVVLPMLKAPPRVGGGSNNLFFETFFRVMELPLSGAAAFFFLCLPLTTLLFRRPVPARKHESSSCLSSPLSHLLPYLWRSSRLPVVWSILPPPRGGQAFP